MNTSNVVKAVQKKTVFHKISLRRFAPIPLVTAFTFALLTYSPTVSASVIRSLELCAKKLIPSLFPFMVTAQLFFSLGASELVAKILGVSFEKLFGISGVGASAFLLGALCGLPLGGKCALELYKKGYITRSECERLAAMSTNAGIGFTVAGVGGALLGNIRLGYTVYFVQITAQIAVGMLLKPHRNDRLIAPITNETSYQPFLSSISSAVSSSAIGTVTVCGYVTFFGVISDLTLSLCETLGVGAPLRLVLVSLTELTCACNEIKIYLSSIEPTIRNFAFSALFFAFGFSGLSVHMQLSAIASETDIRIKNVILTKLLCGAVAIPLGYLATLLFNVK